MVSMNSILYSMVSTILLYEVCNSEVAVLQELFYNSFFEYLFISDELNELTIQLHAGQGISETLENTLTQLRGACTNIYQLICLSLRSSTFSL